MRRFIQLVGVSYTYDSEVTHPVFAVEDISLSVDKGEYVAILGANGSGKSTLARLCNGLLMPTSGEVWVAGLDTRDDQAIWEVRRRLGMVFQNPDNQIVGTTVEEDVAFGPENLGLPRAEILARIETALAQVGLNEHRQRTPHHLSGGQKQRLAIAGIMAMEPDGIILDEATAMIDPVGRSEVLSTVRALNEAVGMTVLLITHHMVEALEADRVFVMKDGRLIAGGTPRQIFQQTDVLAAAGLEAPPMALLTAELRRRGFTVPADILSVEELVDALCPSSSNR